MKRIRTAVPGNRKVGKALLVAKPWKGGLGDYFFLALQDFYQEVEWVRTYPVTFRDNMLYRKDKKKWRARLVERIASTKYDVAFFINTLCEFSALSNPDKHVVWLTDDPRPVKNHLESFGQVYLADAGYRDDIVGDLKAGQFCGILPFAHLPKIHTPFKGGNANHGICFIGNRDPKRDAFLRILLNHQIQIKVYGNYFIKDALFWSYPGNFLPSVANSKMGKIYSRFLISLNIHAQVVRQGTNMRTFECAGYGIPQIVEFRPGLADYFEPEKEIVVFRSADEMIEKINANFRNRNEIKKMAVNARRRALGEHTYHHRINTLINQFR